MGHSMKLRLSNRLDEIPRLAEAVDGFFQANGLPADLAFTFNLALDEVVTNVISYAYDDGAEHQIEVRLGVEPDGGISAAVIDDGVAYDPLSRPEPDTESPLEERPVGGLGVHLVRSLMDRIEYRREGGRNRLEFSKR